MRSLSALSAAVLAFAAVISPCFANSTAVCGMIAGGPIPQNYLAGTNKCSVGETVGARTLHCVDDGGIAATFGTSVTEYQAAVAGGGWLTWSVPPFSEYAYPWVGFTSGSSNTITLTRAGGVFGFEIEPNNFSTFAVSAAFLDVSGNVLTTVTQNVTGYAGAAVFAAVCNHPVIKTVSISVDPNAMGFAVAEIRSDKALGILAPVPVTGTATPIPASVPAGTAANHQ